MLASFRWRTGLCRIARYAKGTLTPHPSLDCRAALDRGPDTDTARESDRFSHAKETI